MNDSADDETPWGGGRRGADAELMKFDTLAQAMKHSGPYNPQPVTIEVAGYLLIDEAPGVEVPRTIEIEVFITAIRVVMLPDFEYPEWEFECWLKEDTPERTWLRGELKVIPGVDDELEVTLYRLEPGEEWGVSPTLGLD